MSGGTRRGTDPTELMLPAVELGCLNERQHDRRALTTAIGAGAQPRLPPKRSPPSQRINCANIPRRTLLLRQFGNHGLSGDEEPGNGCRTLQCYRLLLHDHPRYCSSLTFSIQSTGLPFSASWMAICVIAVDGVAPCQCFSPGGNQIASPGLISSTGPPQHCTHPNPEVTINAWPSGCVCQAVRAPGSNVTLAARTRAGSGASNNGSIQTVPVK
jgi:hypothetical protein